MCLLSSAICLQIYEVLGVLKSILHKAHSALMTTNTLSIWLNPWVGICPVTVWTFSRSPHKVGKRVHHLWGPDSFMCSSGMHCTYSTYRASPLHQEDLQSRVPALFLFPDSTEGWMQRSPGCQPSALLLSFSPRLSFILISFVTVLLERKGRNRHKLQHWMQDL